MQYNFEPIYKEKKFPKFNAHIQKKISFAIV